MKKLLIALSLSVITILSGCKTDSQVASRNLSKAADMFQISRRIVFYNSWSDGYMLTIEGLCSIKVDGLDKQLEVTCKTGQNSYKKHFLGLSESISYFVEQLHDKPVSVFHYKVIFRPESIIPDVDLETSL